MPQFPDRKADKDALYSAILTGIAANPVDYPNGLGQPFNTTTLTTLNNTKNTAKTTRQTEEGQFRVAVTAENAAYTNEDTEARRIINLAIATHGVNSPKLVLIGWGPIDAADSQVAGQPRQLEAVVQGPGDVFLDWKNPLPGGGFGEVSFYRVERRQRTLVGAQTEDWGAWQATTTVTEMGLSGLTRGVEFDFRVVAVNSAGDSVPSNIVTAVL